MSHHGLKTVVENGYTNERCMVQPGDDLFLTTTYGDSLVDSQFMRCPVLNLESYATENINVIHACCVNDWLRILRTQQFS